MQQLGNADLLVIRNHAKEVFPQFANKTDQQLDFLANRALLSLQKTVYPWKKETFNQDPSQLTFTFIELTCLFMALIERGTTTTSTTGGIKRLTSGPHTIEHFEAKEGTEQSSTGLSIQQQIDNLLAQYETPYPII